MIGSLPETLFFWSKVWFKQDFIQMQNNDSLQCKLHEHINKITCGADLKDVVPNQPSTDLKSLSTLYRQPITAVPVSVFYSGN